MRNGEWHSWNSLAHYRPSLLSKWLEKIHLIVNYKANVMVCGFISLSPFWLVRNSVFFFFSRSLVQRKLSSLMVEKPFDFNHSLNLRFVQFERHASNIRNFQCSAWYPVDDNNERKKRTFPVNSLLSFNAFEVGTGEKVLNIITLVLWSAVGKMHLTRMRDLYRAFDCILILFLAIRIAWMVPKMVCWPIEHSKAHKVRCSWLEA